MSEFGNTLNKLIEEFKNNDVSDGWHDNIAMMINDCFDKHDVTCAQHELHHVSNKAASIIMKICFDVETKKPSERNKNGK